MYERAHSLENILSFIQENIFIHPKIALILGSGLGRLVEEVAEKNIFSYTDIPGFPVLTVQGHKGELVAGELGEKDVLVWNGRFHLYQGLSADDVTLPVRVSRRLGVEVLIVTNASGGINRNFAPGDIMLISDHINYMGVNPLIGKENAKYGPIFIDMSEPYDRELIDHAKKCAYETGEKNTLREGVYLATLGPSYETKAEIEFFRRIGADAVGMSTVPEVIVAAQEKMRVLGISVITNMACGITQGRLSHTAVLKTMSSVEKRVSRFVKAIIEKIPDSPEKRATHRG
jgi:purine-nucleoside phosphorylase